MLTLVEAMKMLTEEEEGADSEAVEVVFAEIDRLQAELRRMREANPPLIAAVTSDLYNKEMARWRAETDQLCGPKKGGRHESNTA